MKKLSSIYLILMLILLICSNSHDLSESSIIKVKQAFSNQDTNVKVNNPIFGMDFWETPKIYKGNSVDWTVEFEKEEMVNLIHFEFDYPPSKLIIYIGEFITHLMPYKIVDYTQAILKASGKYSLLKSNDSLININYPIRFITLKFLNEMDIPISVQFLKFTAISQSEKARYVVSRLVYSNDKLINYCLKYDSTKKKLNLVECYYCIMYGFEDCQFGYKGNDQNKILLSKKNNNFEFFIKSPNLNTFNVNYKPPKNVQLLTSFLSDEVDYSVDLLEIKSNSTVSNDYPVKNVLYDNLDYWSSDYLKAKGCPEAKIVLIFKESLVIKNILIDWVKAPYTASIYICEKGETKCKLIKKLNDFQDLKTMLSNIYHKGSELKVVMGFDKSRMREFNYECICSISQIKVQKNEIDMRSVKKEEEDDSNTKKLYSNNFYITKLDDFNTKYTQFDTYEESLLENSLINLVKSEIQKSFINKNSKFMTIVSNFTEIVNEYNSKLSNIIKESDNHERKLLRYIKEFDASQIINDLTFKNDLNNKTLDYYEMKSYFSNLNSAEATIRSSYINSFRNLKNMQNDLNQFLVYNSSYYYQTYSDKFITFAFDSINKIQTEYKSTQILSDIKKLQDYIPLVDEGFNAIKTHSTPQIKLKLNKLENTYSNIISAKNISLKELVQRFELILIKFKFVRPIVMSKLLSIGNSPKLIKLLTNSLYDHVYVKFMVNFNRESKNEFNIFIFKYLTSEVYYYLKYNYKVVEIWKKSYDIEENLFVYDKCTNEYDKYDQIENFSKLFFITIKVAKGLLSVALKIDYHPIPEEIQKYLNSISEINYHDLIQIYNKNENDYGKYFSNATHIFSYIDIDLNREGYFAIDSPRSNTKILLAGPQVVTEAKNVKENTALNSKYPFGFFNDIRKFPKVEKDKNLMYYLGLDDTWEYYDTQFQVIKNFYFKFEINLDKIFGDSSSREQQNSVYLHMLSDRSSMSYFLEFVKVEEGFILKFFNINTQFKKTNLFRKRLTITNKNTKVLTISFVKNNETMILRLKIKSLSLYNNVFNLSNFTFIKFFFLLNPRNSPSIQNIYSSDTYGGAFTNVKKKKLNDSIRIKSMCSRTAFEIYNCVIKDNSICKNLFCKGCCSKKLMKSNQVKYSECWDSCMVGLRDKEGYKIRMY